MSDRNSGKVKMLGRKGKQKRQRGPSGWQLKSYHMAWHGMEWQGSAGQGRAAQAGHMNGVHQQNTIILLNHNRQLGQFRRKHREK